MIGICCRANMSSPVMEGTRAATAYTSRDIHILSEVIYIRIDAAYRTARFTVDYTLKSDSSGVQIPLLFYAQDFRDSFSVWVDGQLVPLQNIPAEYTRFLQSPFSGFAASRDNEEGDPPSDEVLISWQKNQGEVYKLNDLKYFETGLEKGEHRVRVEYTANVWTDHSGWIKKYSFRYSLTPAKFWKSFGSLQVITEQEGTVKPLQTNLGAPIEKIFSEKNSWKFTGLPDEYIEFSWTPTVSPLANALIAIGPAGLSIFTGISLLAIHLLLARGYRRKNLYKKYSPVVILGSLAIPLLMVLSYLYSFTLIDRAIGEAAGRHHGYVFLVILLYPAILPVYWAAMWLLDKQHKKKLLHP